MLKRIQELRKHEEGQALVLAAICMLVLALCVVATINLSYATSEKIRLQNAADAAAYTSAADEARVLNFLAYTNRAMVAHYCAHMNLLAYHSFLYFIYVFSRAATNIPYIGPIFWIIAGPAMVAMYAWEAVSAIGELALEGANAATAFVQVAVANAMPFRIAAGALAEVRKYNPAYRINPIASTVLGVNEAMNWAKTVSTGGFSLFPASSDEDKFNRLLMMEIANGSRHPWTAHGGGNGSFPLVRRATLNFDIGVAGLYFGKTGRAEWGAFRPTTTGTSLFSKVYAAITPQEQMYSIDALTLELKILGFKISLSLFSYIRADKKLQGRWHELSSNVGDNCRQVCGGGFFGGLCRAGCSTALAPVKGIMAAVSASIQALASFPDSVPHIHAGIAPYARFRPGKQRWSRPRANEMFNQQPTVVIVTEPTTDLVRRARPFMRNFSASLGGLSANNSALVRMAGATSKASKRGYTSGTDFRPTGNGGLPGFADGFNAISAGLAYYHRPGDWREPPNLFNPFWGAKLMPVTDYPLIANNPLFSPFVRTNLLVH